MQAMFIWGFGLLGSAMLGCLFGVKCDEKDPAEAAGFGAFAGIFLFISLRLWFG